MAGTTYGGQTAVVQASELTSVQGVTATACPGGVDIQWVGLPLVTGARYYINRSTSSQPNNWTELNASVVQGGFFAVIVPASQAEFFDATAIPGTQYNYEVVLGYHGSANGTASVTVPLQDPP